MRTKILTTGKVVRNFDHFIQWSIEIRKKIFLSIVKSDQNVDLFSNENGQIPTILGGQY